MIDFGIMTFLIQVGIAVLIRVCVRVTTHTNEIIETQRYVNVDQETFRALTEAQSSVIH